MAKRHYTIPHFVQNIDIDLLEAYFKQASIPLPEELKVASDGKKPDAAAIDAYIKTLETSRQDLINNNFIDINEMAYEGGILSILEIAEQFNVYPQQEIENLADYNNQSFYLFLNYRDIFEEASKIDYFVNLSSKSTRYSLFKKPPDVVCSEQAREALAAGLKTYFKKKEGRGEVCEIDVISYKDRVFYHAHPQDYYKIIDSYDEKGKNKRVIVRPQFDVIFVYYTNEGKLELSVSGGEKRKMDIFNIFNKQVLGDSRPVEKTQQTYDFNKVLSPGFEMPTKVEDHVSWRYLKQLRLSYKGMGDKKIILEIDDKNADGTTVMHNMLQELQLNTEQLNVTQATFKIKFPGAKNKGSVTARISYPDKCNLKNTPTHLKAMEYLKYWGLEINNEQGNS